MFVGLLFYIPEHNETKIRNSEFSTPSGSETVVVIVIVVIIVVVAPSDHDPHPMIFIFSSNLTLF